jgi:ATP-dependent DNA ligase
MSLLDLTEAIPRKPTPIFLIIENSPLINGAKIDTLNDSFAALVEELAAVSESDSSTEIQIAALEYGGEIPRWITSNGPVYAKDFVWQPLHGIVEDAENAESTENIAIKPSAFGIMCEELNAKLSRKVFMRNVTGYYPPLIVLFSHCPSVGAASRPQSEAALESLRKNNWFKHGEKAAVAIGRAADREILKAFTGDEDDVLDANTPNALRRIISSINTPRLSISVSVPAAPVVPETPAEPAAVQLKSGPVSNTARSVIAQDYKKSLSRNFISLSPDKIDEYLNAPSYFVTRKYDGELTLVFFENGKAAGLNSSGSIIPDLPCIKETERCLEAVGFRSAVLAGEVYADETQGRTRVFDAAAALADSKKHDSLRLAVFDIVSINGTAWETRYDETHKKLREIFSPKTLPAPVRCTPVRWEKTESKARVKELFNEWVLNEGSEGLVIRGSTRAAVKIKPRLSIDAAVVGFSESEIPGFVRTLLYALINEDGSWQIIGRTGNGLTEDQKKSLYKRLSASKIKSNYIEVDSNRAAFHLVRPELVVELEAGDVICENSKGDIINPILELQDGVFKQSGRVPGFSLISAVIKRFRDDKKPDDVGVRISQINSRAYRSQAGGKRPAEKLIPSTILVRDVYKKEGAAAVQKYMVWKTNKEAHGYPAYVFSFTNFSAGKAEPLSIDMRVSGSEQQIMALYRDFLAKNVKTGWVTALHCKNR